jgi:hypothetical protein
LILLGLALGTWATIFYDIWKLVQNVGSVKKEDVVDEKPSAIGYDLTPNEWEKDE